MSLTTIFHKGKEVVFADYKSCKSTEEVFALLEKQQKH